MCVIVGYLKKSPRVIVHDKDHFHLVDLNLFTNYSMPIRECTVKLLD